MWFERFVIIVTSLYRDFLPSAWGTYRATTWDYLTFIGTLGLFTTLFLLFVRFLPMIPMNEIRMLLPAAKIKPKAAAGAGDFNACTAKERMACWPNSTRRATW